MTFWKEYKKSLKVIEAEDIFDIIIFRPLGYIAMRILYHTRLTPNHVSTLSGILGVITGILLVFRNRIDLVIIGIAILIFSMILDCADGQLARAKKNGSKFGHLVDALFDYITYIFLYAGMAFNLQFTTGNPYISPLTSGGVFWWVFMLLAGACTMYHSMLVDGAKTLFINVVTERSKDYFHEEINKYQNELDEKINSKAGFFKKFPYFIFINYLKIQSKSLDYNKKIDKDKFYRRNKLIMRLWTLAGPSAKLVLIMICALFQRFDIFVWIVLVPLNIIAILLWFIQKSINRSI